MGEHALNGSRFGALKVIRKSRSDNGAVMECACDCGATIYRKASSLNRSGKLGCMQSCGCTAQEREILLQGKRTCPRCEIKKDTSAFSSCATNRLGYQVYCKDCYGVWRDNHADYLKASKREYYFKNKTEISRRKKITAKNDREGVARRSREWVARNPEKRKKVAKEYAKRNPERYAFIAARRRARKIKATPEWADAEKILSIYQESKKISSDTGVNHHVDHIVPLISRLVCGLHCANNLQIITASENQSKNNRYWPDMPEQESV